MSSNDTAPDTIHGGCLCEGVRYRVDFPRDFDFSKGCSTCQCVQCRKNAGALVVHLRRIDLGSITFTARGTLKRYYATPGIARGFCGGCGSFLFWQREEAGDGEGEGHLSLAVGTVDKDDMLRHGALLAKAEMHIWCAEEVPGTVGSVEGERWRYDNEGEDAQRV